MTKPDTNTEPEHVRRKLAAAYRKQAENPRRSKIDRAAFKLMAEAWERTFRA